MLILDFWLRLHLPIVVLHALCINELVLLQTTCYDNVT